MKELYSRILAVVLCIMMIAAIFPVSVFAEHGLNEQETLMRNGFMPGELSVTLYEQYYTVDEAADKNLADILPEIEIESYLDQYLCVMNEAQKQTIKEKDPEYAAMIGKRFHITLAEKTFEAVEAAMEELKDNRFIKYVGPNYCGYVDDVTPNDPYFAPATGTPQWGLDRIGAPEAWDYITGSDMTDGSELGDYVKVAVIDTGVYDQHPDLGANLDMSLAYNAFLDTPGNTSDAYGHGTHVAGIIGAMGNNNIGVAGVCWKVEMVPIKVTNDSALSNSLALERAINYAKNNDILIANTSLSIGIFDDDVITAIRNYSNSGGLLIKSAGNNHSDIDSNTAFVQLAGISGVIMVGALKYDMSGDDRADFSNYGSTVVDLFAPGVDIMSTVPYSVEESGYQLKNGTSMATPFVTGTAALIKSANTTYSNIAIKDVILDNVVTSSNLSGLCSTSGRLNIPDALYDMGYQVIISNTMTHGTVRPSAIFTKPNTIVYLTAYPDAGYMLKPGTMKHNSNNTITVNKWRTFFAMPYSNDTITAQFYMVGDIDFDEAITVADALAALRHYAGNYTLTGDAFLAADVDGDGDVDLTDAQTIQSFAAHMIDHFPIEE